MDGPLCFLFCCYDVSTVVIFFNCCQLCFLFSFILYCFNVWSCIEKSEVSREQNRFKLRPYTFFLLTVPTWFVCSSYSLFVRRWFLIVCSLSLLLLVPLEGISWVSLLIVSFHLFFDLHNQDHYTNSHLLLSH